MAHLENDWPEDAGEDGAIEIKLERCWSQPREGEKFLFHRFPIERFRTPPGTEIICPSMDRYAVVPVEDLAYLYRRVRPGMLPPRLKAMRKAFLQWLEQQEGAS